MGVTEGIELTTADRSNALEPNTASGRAKLIRWLSSILFTYERTRVLYRFDYTIGCRVALLQVRGQSIKIAIAGIKK